VGQTLYQLDGANDAHPLGLHLLTLHLLHPTHTMPFGHHKLSKIAIVYIALIPLCWSQAYLERKERLSKAEGIALGKQAEYSTMGIML